jgi:hypothetical protein
MPDYGKLREYVSHRITIEYDTGAKIVGYVSACKQAAGPVQIMNMTRVEILDSTGRKLEEHATFSFVPNALVGFRITEGPSGRERPEERRV